MLPWGAPEGMYGTFVATPVIKWDGLQVKCKDSQFHIYPPGPFVTHWLVTGTFPNPDHEGWNTTYPPETRAGCKSAKWRDAKADKTGLVNLCSLLEPNEWVVAYALSYVYSPDNRKVEMLFGSDDGAKLWVIDLLVISHKSPRSYRQDEDTVEVNLRKGWNKVLAKITQGLVDWGFGLRFWDPEGKLRYDTSPLEIRGAKS